MKPDPRHSEDDDPTKDQADEGLPECAECGEPFVPVTSKAARSWWGTERDRFCGACASLRRREKVGFTECTSSGGGPGEGLTPVIDDMKARRERMKVQEEQGFKE